MKNNGTIVYKYSSGHRLSIYKRSSNNKIGYQVTAPDGKVYKGNFLKLDK